MEGKTDSATYGEKYLAHLAHELRTPLTAIIGYADAMRARTFGPLNEHYVESAEIIGEAGRHMLELAEDLLARARIDAPADAPVIESLDPAEPVAWALRLMSIEANAAGVALRFAPPAPPLQMISERRALAQMVVNLVANAIRYTPPGGAVTVTLETREQGLVELMVSDTGTGVTAGSETAGLGLSLVRELVAARGGTLSLAGSPDMGTVARIRLPAAEVAP